MLKFNNFTVQVRECVLCTVTSGSATISSSLQERAPSAALPPRQIHGVVARQYSPAQQRSTRRSHIALYSHLTPASCKSHPPSYCRLPTSPQKRCLYRSIQASATLYHFSLALRRLLLVLHRQSDTDMEFPDRSDNNGNDGSGRRPQKLAQAPPADDEQNNVVEAFGDEATDLPFLILLFIAALFAEQFRRQFHCTC